jgi:hypothetical protein
MVPSLQAMLTGLIDYAGLFPPAQLPLADALANYARYRSGPRAWMLGRFVCPAARLAELPPPDDDLFQHGPPWVFSALGRGGGTSSDFLDNLRLDLEAIDVCRDRQEGRVVVDVLELKLPPDADDRDAVRGLLVAAAEMIYETDRPSLRSLFYEITAAGSPTAAVVAALADDNAMGGHAAHWVSGLKVRCGGLAGPSPYPSAELLAATLVLCRDAQVPLKATAGLHHPLPKPDDKGHQQHGFLNVFGAGVLAHARRLGEDQVRRILQEHDASRFIFDEAGFHWNELVATAAEVSEARETVVLSFGSCSFEEPGDDLHALGLIG